LLNLEAIVGQREGNNELFVSFIRDVGTDVVMVEGESEGEVRIKKGET
jgi:hypothetical protein